jgi:hypothetical protein
MYLNREEDELFFYVGFTELTPRERKSPKVRTLAVSKGYEILMKAHGRKVRGTEGDVFSTIDELAQELGRRFSRWFCERCGALVRGEVKRYCGEAVCTKCFYGR